MMALTIPYCIEFRAGAYAGSDGPRKQRADDDARGIGALFAFAHLVAAPRAAGAPNDEVASTGFVCGAYGEPVAGTCTERTERFVVDQDEAVGSRIEAVGERSVDSTRCTCGAREYIVVRACRQVDEQHFSGLDNSKAAGRSGIHLEPVFFHQRSYMNFDRLGRSQPRCERELTPGRWVTKPVGEIGQCMENVLLALREGGQAFVSFRAARCVGPFRRLRHRLIPVISKWGLTDTYSKCMVGMRAHAQSKRFSVARPLRDNTRPQGQTSNPRPQGRLFGFEHAVTGRRSESVVRESWWSERRAGVLAEARWRGACSFVRAMRVLALVSVGVPAWLVWLPAATES